MGNENFPLQMFTFEGGSHLTSSWKSPCNGSSEACNSPVLNANYESSNKYLPAFCLPRTICHFNITTNDWVQIVNSHKKIRDKERLLAQLAQLGLKMEGKEFWYARRPDTKCFYQVRVPPVRIEWGNCPLPSLLHLHSEPEWNQWFYGIGKSSTMGCAMCSSGCSPSNRHALVEVPVHLGKATCW